MHWVMIDQTGYKEILLYSIGYPRYNIISYCYNTIMGYQYLIFLVDLGLLFINVVDISVVYRVNDGLQNTRHSKS